MQYFEQRLDEENIKSKKVAWFCVGAFALITLTLAFAIFKMLPLKMTDVKLLVVDKVTGYPVSVTDLSTFSTDKTKDITADLALNKFFSQLYIVAHDSYNFYSIRDSYATVQLYSSDNVFSDYAQKFKSPSIQDRLGENKVLDVKVLTMTPQTVETPFKDKPNGGITMQARVEKVIREKDQVLSKTTGTVTMTFGYDADLNMDERTRNANPFGFTVTSYRFDPDQVVQ